MLSNLMPRPSLWDHNIMLFISILLVSLPWTLWQFRHVRWSLSFIIWSAPSFFGTWWQFTKVLRQLNCYFRSSSLGYPSSSLENNHSFLEFLLYLFFVDWQSVFWIEVKQYLGCLASSSNKGKNKVKCVDMNTTLLWLYASVYEVYVQVYSNKWRYMDKKKKMMLKKISHR